MIKHPDHDDLLCPCRPKDRCAENLRRYQISRLPFIKPILAPDNFPNLKVNVSDCSATVLILA
jgi:hypothetical protein